MKISSSVLIILIIAATALVESYPRPGYINRKPSSRSRFERLPNPEPHGFGGFGSGFGGFGGGFSRGGGYDFSYHPPAQSDHGLGTFYQPVPRLNFNFPTAERPSPNNFFVNPMGSGFNLGRNHRIIDNDRGSLDGTAAVLLNPGLDLHPNVGLRGTYHPTPQGTVSANVNKFLGSPVDPRDSIGVGYEHTVHQSKDAKVTVSAEVQKASGKNLAGTVGVGVSYR